MNRQAAMIIDIVFSAAALAISAGKLDGVGIIMALLALFLGAVCCAFDTQRAYLVAIVTGVVVLIGNGLYNTVLSYDSLVADGDMDTDIWCVIVGLIHALVAPLLVAEVYMTSAVKFKASFNWMIVRIFSAFIGLGILIPGFFLEFVFHNIDGLDVHEIVNGYALYGFLLTIAVSFVVGYVLSLRMHKNRIVLDCNGFHVRVKQ